MFHYKGFLLSQGVIDVPSVWLLSTHSAFAAQRHQLVCRVSMFLQQQQLQLLHFVGFTSYTSVKWQPSTEKRPQTIFLKVFHSYTDHIIYDHNDKLACDMMKLTIKINQDLIIIKKNKRYPFLFGWYSKHRYRKVCQKVVIVLIGSKIFLNKVFSLFCRCCCFIRSFKHKWWLKCL